MRLLATANAKVLFSFNQITFMTLEKVIELIKCGRCLLSKACHINVVLIDFGILGSYDELMHEERTCLQEVAAMEKKFDSWSKAMKKKGGGGMGGEAEYNSQFASI